MNWHEHFEYIPDTGLMTWRQRPLSHFPSEAYQRRWNSRHAGKNVGAKAKDKDGRPCCIRLIVYGKNRIAHRVIWEMIHGHIPSGMVVDHINRDPWDNRLCNLRLATHADNSKNKAIQRNNTSGCPGVVLMKGTNKWRVVVDFDGLRLNCGLWVTKEEATAVYRKVARRVHGDFYPKDRPLS